MIKIDKELIDEHGINDQEYEFILSSHYMWFVYILFDFFFFIFYGAQPKQEPARVTRLRGEMQVPAAPITDRPRDRPKPHGCPFHLIIVFANLYISTLW